MSNLDILLTIISALAGCSTIITLFWKVGRASKSDIQKQAVDLADIKSDLHYIKDSVNSLVATTESMKEEQNKLITRVAIVEEKVKTLEKKA